MQLRFERVDNIEVLRKAARQIKATLKPFGLNQGFSGLSEKQKQRALKYGFLTKKDIRG